MAAIETRKPTGRVPWPLILIEGGEKAGKSFSAALLSASDKVGQTYWLDLGEGSGDEYGAIPGARYLLLKHDGSWAKIYGQVEAVRHEARRAADAGEPPVVLVVDSMTAEWDLLKDYANVRARSRNVNKERLRKDPTAELVVSMDLWNEANSRHRKLMTLLMTFPGIVVVTARGKEVAAIGDNGQPVEGKKEYKVEAQKTLGFDATCWIRLYRDAPGVVVGARSVHTGIRPGRDEPKTLPPDWSLEWLIFDALKCNPVEAAPRDLVELRPDETPEQIRDWALDPEVTYDQLVARFHEVTKAGIVDAELTNEVGDTETVGDLLKRVGSERKKPAGTNGARVAVAAAVAAQ